MYRLWAVRCFSQGSTLFRIRTEKNLPFLAKTFPPATLGRPERSYDVTAVFGSRVRILRRLDSNGDADWMWPKNLPPATEWGYERDDGPAMWPLKYSNAGGRYQSPIDIITSEAQESSDLTERPLTWTYGSQICKSVVNTGRGWRVDVTGDDSILSGGPLAHNYQLAQFHCHWGNTSSCGSEHTVDGESYAGELHFVHWNKDLYKSCSDAVAAKKGLAVLGVFLKLGEENSEVEKLAQVLANIKFKDQSGELPADFDPSLMFPTDQSYWTYDGSLTTPPCNESVTWIVFKNPIEITEKQLLTVAIFAIFAAVQASLLAPAAVAVRSDSALTYNLDNQKAAVAVPVGYYGAGVLGYGGVIGAAPYGVGLAHGGVYGLGYGLGAAKAYGLGYGLGAAKAYGLGLGYGHVW